MMSDRISIHCTVIVAIGLCACMEFNYIGAENQPCSTSGICWEGFECCADDICRKSCSEDGDVADGDVVDGDNSENEETCNTNDHYSCESGDVYYFDSCGNKLSKKSECDDCACIDGACVEDDRHAYECYNDDVYYYSCHGERGNKKDECDQCGCSNGSCVINKQYSYACYDNDEYWYDCHGDRQAKKVECGTGGCKNGACLLSCSNGVCTDPVTGFEWQQQPTSQWMALRSAKTYCSGLNLDGSGWRLPNISELRSLIRNCPEIETGGACELQDECPACGISSDDVCLEYSCGLNSCEPPSCTNDGGPTGCYWPPELSGACSWYWSSSPVEVYIDLAWLVHFDDGYVGRDGVANNRYVRCVR